MTILVDLKNRLKGMSDPRVKGRSIYDLGEVLFIVCIAILCGAESWHEMVAFANAREEWFKKYLKLENGIPSHDTFGRIFSIIDCKEMESFFLHWVNSLRKEKKLEAISIDGKTIKGTVKTRLGRQREGLHLINVFDLEDELVLAQAKSNGSGNVEITAAKDLIQHFNLKDVLVLADAGIGRKPFAHEVKKRGGNYLFPVKGNSKEVLNNLKNEFQELNKNCNEIVTKKHGREEIRRCWVSHSKKTIDQVNIIAKTGEYHFPEVKTIARVDYIRKSKENRPWIQDYKGVTKSSVYSRPMSEIRETTFTKYFISDIKMDPETLIEKTRLHWGIENKLHWALDVSFKEDCWRTRDKSAAQNLSVIRKICLNLARRETSSKESMRVKLKKASYDVNYLEKLLFC